MMLSSSEEVCIRASEDLVGLLRFCQALVATLLLSRRLKMA